jgi:tRNA threonylcarbamoyladenosine biosynthesis protein TsaE
MISHMKKRVSHSLEETKQIAHDWLIEVTHKYSDLDEALVVGLSGHLGAGKTAFVKAIANLLGIKQDITSPTFVIMKMYDLDAGPNSHAQVTVPWNRLVHIDAYRLEKPEEMDALRFEDIVADKNNLVMVEWPENVELKTAVHLKLRLLEAGKSIEIQSE